MALLARAQPAGLTYVGSAFIALAGNEREKLRVHLEVNKVERCAIAKFRFPDAQWVRPEIVAGTKYLRHGTVRGFA